MSNERKVNRKENEARKKYVKKEKGMQYRDKIY